MYFKFLRSAFVAISICVAFASCKTSSRSATLGDDASNDCSSIQAQLNKANADLAALPAEPSDSCTALGGVLTNGVCTCADGTPAFRLHGEKCANYSDYCLKFGATMSATGVCTCSDGTPIYKLNGNKCSASTSSGNDSPDATSQRSQLNAKISALQSQVNECQAKASKNSSENSTSAECSKAGGTLASDKICRCPDNTPVFRIGNLTCSEFAKEKAHPNAGPGPDAGKTVQANGCPAGAVLTSAGLCATCPPGTEISPKDGLCYAKGSQTLDQRNAGEGAQTQANGCPAGATLGADGWCRTCPPGTQLGSDLLCH